MEGKTLRLAASAVPVDLRSNQFDNTVDTAPLLGGYFGVTSASLLRA